MRIVVQAADLDAPRIDGTRIYLLRLLERFGALTPQHAWHLFHRKPFNPALTPPSFKNYEEHCIPFPCFWTQTRFSWEIMRRKPHRLFMPVQSLPFFLSTETESIVTIHDLAFKIFPKHFPTKDLRRLNWFTDFSVRQGTRLIAVSESTKRDILTFYPDVPEKKIRVIHHGFDPIPPSTQHHAREEMAALNLFHLSPKNYVLYVGAIQPRKNLLRLLDAFTASAERFPEMKLVLAGEAAWMSEAVFEAAQRHPFRDRIVITDRVSFQMRATLYRNARLFVFPSLYEGFGLPILEAFSARVPVIVARNSSLTEVAGNAAFFFDAQESSELQSAIETLWEDSRKREDLIARGTRELERFSWDRCASETASWILGDESHSSKIHAGE